MHHDINLIISHEINIFIIIFLFFVLLFFCAILSVIIFYIIKLLRKKFNWQSKYLSNKKLKIYFVISSLFFAGYNAYTAVYPTDSFYFNEFKHVTKTEIPSSAKIQQKASTYPDLHGDYSSRSIITLSEKDYQKLLSHLQTSKDKEILKVKPYKDYHAIFQRKIKGKSGELYIYFLKDKKTIKVNIDFF